MSKNNFPPAQRRRIFARDGGRCFYCGCPLHLNPLLWSQSIQGEEHDTYCCLDHLHASSVGGGGADENLVASCRSCNSSKNDKSLEEFRTIKVSQSKPVRAAVYLQAALEALDSPHRAELTEALNWYQAQIKPHVFYGESRK